MRLLKKILPLTLLVLLFCNQSGAQKLSTSNEPSEVYPGGGVVRVDSVYGVFVGRTACTELLLALGSTDTAGCIKRKMALILYHDTGTGQPSTYNIRGLDKWTGRGEWRLEKGRPGDPNAAIIQLNLAHDTFLYLLKGDDNVLFILDRQRNFLVGNKSFAYTLNRAK